MNHWHGLPAELYELVERTPGTVLLESASPASASPACAQPATADSEPEAYPSGGPTRLFTAPIRVCAPSHPADLPNLFEEIQRAVDAGLYAAGYFAYECGAFFEPSAAIGAPPSREPLAWFGIFERPYLFDHRTGAFIGDEPPGLAGLCAATNDQPPANSTVEGAFGIAEEEYSRRITAIHDWIRSGDVYQLNFTLPLTIRTQGSKAALYRRLRSLQPAPYCAFLHTDPNRRILSFSPELFFQIESQAGDRRITTRPMKGTAPRGRTTSEDRAHSEWLRNDPKNRAENVMIVDLLRSDLGRLCTFGSIRTESLFAVERYPTLWQMTSTITGELRAKVNFQQIFRALFPCGSVTGAPKIRAMQLLAQLEQRTRGIYTGAIGFFSRQESVFNVAIRTLAFQGDRGTMAVGSGIVIDSNPVDEWRECLLKAEFLTRSTATPAQPSSGDFSLIETMLWDGSYPLIELHLDRLEDSAGYFGFPCDRSNAKASLEAYGVRFSDLRPRKVRLLLNSKGELSFTDDPLLEHHSKPLRVCISPQRTDLQDPMYFHKTTHRPLYARAFQAAIAAGYDDVLFLNQRDEVTECAIHNIFIEKDGRLLTPPVDCGLLAGVQRRHILATQSNAEERVLTIADLRTADAVYLTNAVRGLRPALIDSDRRPHWRPESEITTKHKLSS
jgi:para-aminobenzoate synthetase/4-amino-4-deoxychorismate lyase